MRARTALCLSLLLVFLVSQSGCFTLMAIEHPRLPHGNSDLAVTLLAVEIVAWPVLIADVVIASAICLSRAESRKRTGSGATTKMGSE